MPDPILGQAARLAGKLREGTLEAHAEVLGVGEGVGGDAAQVHGLGAYLKAHKRYIVWNGEREVGAGAGDRAHQGHQQGAEQQGLAVAEDDVGRK